jgi:hypothetical protein
MSGPNAAENFVSNAKLNSLPRPAQAVVLSLQHPVTNATLYNTDVLSFGFLVLQNYQNY